MKLITAILLLIFSSCSKVDLNEYSYEGNKNEVTVQVRILIAKYSYGFDKDSYAVELVFDKWVIGNISGNVKWKCESTLGGNYIHKFDREFSGYVNGYSMVDTLGLKVYDWLELPVNVELVSIECNGYIFKQ